MSWAGNCYDIAMIELFWSTLKTGTGMYVTIPAILLHAELVVFFYIESFYNSRRCHCSQGQISYESFELKYEKSYIKSA